MDGSRLARTVLLRALRLLLRILRATLCNSCSNFDGSSSCGFIHQKSTTPRRATSIACMPQSTFGQAPAMSKSGVPRLPPAYWLANPAVICFSRS
eukprot:482751-Amphidinium_carterae.1